MQKILYPIGQRIRDVRKRKKLSQKDLARKIGIKQPSLSEIENGYSEPREATLIALVRELDDVLGRNDLYIHLPKKYSTSDLAEMVNEETKHPLMLEWFVYELTELNQEFRSMLNDGAYKKALRVGSEMRVNFNFDGIDEVEEKMNQYIEMDEEIQSLGTVDEFDVEESIEKHKTLEETIEAWYKFENKEMPEGFGLNFDGWHKLSLEDKIQTVKDVKKFADAMNEKIDKGEIDYE